MNKLFENIRKVRILGFNFLFLEDTSTWGETNKIKEENIFTLVDVYMAS